MTEQEVIEYLKNNRNNGVAFSFYPLEVKKWVKEHINDLEMLQADGIFTDDFELDDINGGDVDGIKREDGYITIFEDIVLTLDPDFELQEKQKKQ